MEEEHNMSKKADKHQTRITAVNAKQDAINDRGQSCRLQLAVVPNVTSAAGAAAAALFIPLQRLPIEHDRKEMWTCH